MSTEPLSKIHINGPVAERIEELARTGNKFMAVCHKETEGAASILSDLFERKEMDWPWGTLRAEMAVVGRYAFYTTEQLNHFLGNHEAISTIQFYHGLLRNGDKVTSVIRKLSYWLKREQNLRHRSFITRLHLTGSEWKTLHHKTNGDDARFVRWCMANENVSTLRVQLRALLEFDTAPNLL